MPTGEMDTAVAPRSLVDRVNARATALMERRLYNEAFSVAQLAHRLAEQEPDPMHPDMGNSLHNLAELYRAASRYVEAERFYREAVQLRAAVLGAEHPATVAAQGNLARTLVLLRRLPEAEELCLEVIGTLRRTAPDGDALPSMLNDLAEAYKAARSFERAEELYREALSMSGEASAQSAVILNNYGRLMHERGELAEAERLLMRALETGRSVWGAESLQCAGTLNNLSTLYKQMERYERARAYLEESLRIKEAILGTEHLEYGIGLNNMAGLADALGDTAAAESYYLRALLILRRQVGDVHPMTVSLMVSLGGLYVDNGKPAAAVELLREAEAAVRALEGDGSARLNTILLTLAEASHALGDHAAVERYFAQARLETTT